MDKITEKKLIINADDAGLSDDINKAIRRGFQEGVITSSSIIACGEAFKQATEMFHVIKKTNVGVHLTLTGSFLPITTDKAIASLTEDGKFLKDYQSLLYKYLGQGINMDEVALEFNSQIDKVRKEGLSISHLDSHEHIHLFPKILEVVIRIAKENNIKYIRVPAEPTNVFLKEFKLKDVVRYSGLKAFVLGAKKKAQDNGLLCNDFFWGHFHSGRLNGEILSFILDNLKPGINELCVHPAYASENFLKKYPWYKNANNEIDALIDEKFLNKISVKKIKLIDPESLDQAT